MSILPKLIGHLQKIMINTPKLASMYFDLIQVFTDKSIEINLSEKDKQNPDYEEWIKDVKEQYSSSGKVWYK